MLQNLAALVDEATAELEQYEYAKALAKIESFFWDFCDNYVEAAKSRRYGDFGPEAAASASTAMRLALSVLLRLLAPYLSFVCEEVWSWSQAGLDPSRRVADARRADRACRAPTSRARQAVLHADRSAERDPQRQDRSEGVDRHAGEQVVYPASDEAIACLTLVERDLKAAVARRQR